MKNRKIIITAFILVAIMVLGVGYAAVTDTLDIQGTADINEQGATDTFNTDVYFAGVLKDGSVSASVVDDVAGYTANINMNDNDMAHFTVSGLKSQGDSVTITYVVQNDSTNAVQISKKNSSTTEAIFQITTELDSAAKTIDAGSTTTVWVTITLLADPAEALTSAFVFGITANPVAG